MQKWEYRHAIEEFNNDGKSMGACLLEKSRKTVNNGAVFHFNVNSKYMLGIESIVYFRIVRILKKKSNLQLAK